MRKKRHEEHVNHEAWAIPYADLMTLLLAFFVVMYAVSVVNAGKFRVMSASMSQAFNGGSPATAPPEAGKHAPQVRAISLPHFFSPISAPIQLPIPQHAAAVHANAPRAVRLATLGQIEDKVQHVLQPLIDRQLVVLRRTPERLEIEIRTDILFPSGVAKLSKSATQILLELGRTLAPFPNPLRVEGFTDDVPINTPLYPSNWELSAARAARVARLFADNGVRPARLGIVGWGEVRPIASNATAQGRNHNRRVLVVVQNDLPGLPDAGAAASVQPRPADPLEGGRSALPTHYVAAPRSPVGGPASFASSSSAKADFVADPLASSPAATARAAAPGPTADVAGAARPRLKLSVAPKRGDNELRRRSVPATSIRQ
ncbi:MAG: flagellar motor protein MotD [Rhodanobacter sp.]|nr:MAG: flagellar motor protein MotD [Rhodanobacter sp.]